MAMIDHLILNVNEIASRRVLRQVLVLLSKVRTVPIHCNQSERRLYFAAAPWALAVMNICRFLSRRL
jgi:hypothetical protein